MTKTIIPGGGKKLKQRQSVISACDGSRANILRLEWLLDLLSLVGIGAVLFNIHVSSYQRSGQHPQLIWG